MSDLLSIKEASIWASNLLNKEVSTSNIAYLITYGKISKIGENGGTQISKTELEKYYQKQNEKEELWKKKLGDDLNWNLSFENLKESDTTKHVHRLHPYKGKFIPQLVEYFLDDHTDEFKKEVYFHKGDIILDPFCGSGTTLVQSNELGINAIGVDISLFNTLISECKVKKYDLKLLKKHVDLITNQLEEFNKANHTDEFEKELLEELAVFNKENFPSPEYKTKIQKKLIDGKFYGRNKELDFLNTYNNLIEKHKIELLGTLDTNEISFMDKWFIKHVINELKFVANQIDKIDSLEIKEILKIILSRTMRSCRATTHSDLATLKKAVTTTYYCTKHFKICKPLFSILKWWRTYSKDTIKRLNKFDSIRTNTNQICLTGDSRNIDIIQELGVTNIGFAQKVKEKKISGIFSSPPYVGVIDYHEQHAYAYDLFGFERKEDKEIGPLYKGQGKAAQASYIDGIVKVLLNSKKYLAENYNVFLVANDKYNLYPEIANQAGMTIVNKYKRPVLNRTEKDKGAYAEIIFHLREKSK
jgi:hypothetical protein